jgi:PemK-like, MazF-like toxin of type II toxin-antitoxin system
MASFERGDVVIVDLGMTAKVRPCVVISVSKPDSQRNMSVVVPMTTEIRGGECEIPFPKPAWLRQEAYRFNERSKDDAGRFIGAMSGIFNRRLTYEDLTRKAA